MITLKIGPNAIVAKVDLEDFSTLFNSTNCKIIYQCDGNYESWTPGNALNAISGSVAGKGYLAIMKQTLDVSEAFFSLSDLSGEPTFNLINNSGDILYTHSSDGAGNMGTLFGGNASLSYHAYEKAFLEEVDAGYVGISNDSGESKSYLVSVIKTHSGTKSGTTAVVATINIFEFTTINQFFNMADLAEGDVTVVIGEVLPG